MNRSDYFQFDFERLDVYQKALKFTNKVFRITSGFSREFQYSLGEQFRRAALSICNNIAEGSRKPGKSRIQFYNYALDSTRECIPMISIATEQSQLDQERVVHLRQECIDISRMLYRLVESAK